MLALVVMAAMGAGPRTRTIRGKVIDGKGNALEGAVVQVKDLHTLWIQSHITRADGTFRFPGQPSKADHEVRATYRGKWSAPVLVTRFDSRRTVDLDLIVELDSP